MNETKRAIMDLKKEFNAKMDTNTASTNSKMDTINTKMDTINANVNEKFEIIMKKLSE